MTYVPEHHTACPTHEGHWFNNSTKGCTCGAAHKEWPTKRPWYIEITRDAEDPDDRSKIGPPMESIVIGPFDTEEVAVAYMDSPDVDDWVTDEAKQKRYIVDDCVVKQAPLKMPSYGVNAPVLMYVEGTPEHEAAFGEMPGLVWSDEDTVEHIRDDNFVPWRTLCGATSGTLSDEPDKTYTCTDCLNTEPPAPPAVGLRLLAHYPMMGDEDGVLWAESVLADAKTAGSITGFKVLTSLPGIYGIQHIVFTVDIGWKGPVGFWMDHEQGTEAAKAWLNGVLIQDSDVDLLALSPLHAADITHQEV